MLDHKKAVAVVYALIGFSSFGIVDASYKWLSDYAPNVTNAFLASIVSLLIVVGYGLFSKKSLVFWTLPKRNLHILRGFLISLQILTIIYALSKMPLAMVYTILFCAPFITVILAKLIFKETLSLKSALIILAGFGGVFLVFRPELSDLKNLSLLSAALGALMISLVNITSRAIGDHRDNAYAYAFYTMLTVSIVAGIFHFFMGEMPPPSTIPAYSILVCTGLVGTIAVALAFSKAPAVLIAPFQYTQIIWGIGLGWLVFGDKPDIYAIIGISIIIASGIALLWEKNRDKA